MVAVDLRSSVKAGIGGKSRRTRDLLRLQRVSWIAYRCCARESQLRRLQL
jgi:hypothetical protein